MTAPEYYKAMQQDNSDIATADAIAAYLAGIGELETAVAGMTQEQLLARPVPGKWSTLEVVCHLADCEQFLADRMKRVAALERPLLMSVDEQQYVDGLHYHDRDLHEELQLIAATRRQLARVLSLLPETAFQRTGVHSEAGLLTLRQLLLQANRHLRHHLKFVAEKRAALPA